MGYTILPIPIATSSILLALAPQFLTVLLAPLLAPSRTRRPQGVDWLVRQHDAKVNCILGVVSQLAVLYIQFDRFLFCIFFVSKFLYIYSPAAL